ncbi:MAG: sensor domain-containing diguanylate cyclase [Thermoanaerobaculia bacterium]
MPESLPPLSLAWAITAIAAIAAVLAWLVQWRQASNLRRLHRSERLYRLLFERSKDVLAVSTADGKLVDINPAGVELYGYDSKQQMLELDLEDLYADPGERRRILKELEARGFVRGFETRHKTRSGEVVIVQATTAVVRDDHGRIEYLLAVLRDVTEQRRAEERLLHLARFDSLTGLPNRHTFLDQVSNAIARVGRFGHRMAVLLFDLDELKSATDTHGHEVGDALLLAFARRLQRNVRKVDTLARIGVLRFAVLKSDFVDRQAAVKLAERLIANLDRPFRVMGHEIRVPIAVGIALYPPGDGEPEQLLDRADQALGDAKSQGPGSYACDGGE